MTDPLLDLCRQVSATVPDAGAVALVGSHARGDATAESDVDLLVLGPAPGDGWLERRGDRLFSVSVTTVAEVRQGFRRARTAVAAVPAWRGAVAVSDPAGSVAALRAEATAWSWELVAADARAHVAAQAVGLAEEVHKLVAALRRDRPRTAAVQRAVLALQLPMAMAVHLGQTYRSENEVWDLVARLAGPAWAADQDAALGITAAGHAGGCRAALRLYLSFAERVRDLLDDRQRTVVEAAADLARPACRSGRGPFDASLRWSGTGPTA
jgi:hypothetical protein